MVIGRDGQSCACDGPAAKAMTTSAENHKRDIADPLHSHPIHYDRVPYHRRDDAGQPKFCAQRKMILSHTLLPERDA
jgi:hypothetical protein